MRRHTVNLAIGEIHTKKRPYDDMVKAGWTGLPFAPPWRVPSDCSFIKDKSLDDGILVCLKEYDERSLHPDDLQVIKRHRLKQTEDGTPYYDFTSERTLEEIQAEKKRLLKEGNWKFDNETIFGEGQRTVHIPEHWETLHLYWDCDNDHWVEEIEGGQ